MCRWLGHCAGLPGFRQSIIRALFSHCAMLQIQLRQVENATGLLESENEQLKEKLRGKQNEIDELRTVMDEIFNGSR